jgi:hypothetical protein
MSRQGRNAQPVSLRAHRTRRARSTPTSSPSPELANMASTGPGSFDTVRASDIRPAKIEWLWNARIPFGRLTLLEGDPGLGKSILTLEIVARATRGEPLFEDSGRRKPIHAVVLGGEDDEADTIHPRLSAARADLERVDILTSDSVVRFPDGAPLLEECVRRYQARLVVIDPLSAFVTGFDTRAALRPVHQIAARTGAAIILVRHRAKHLRGSAISQGLGGIGVSGIVRSGLLWAQHPEDAGSRVLASFKLNIAERPISLRASVVRAAKGSARIEWLGKSHYSADDLSRTASANARVSVSEAKRFLSDLFQHSGGPIRADRVKEQGRTVGISTRTLERAAREVVASKRATFGGPVLWIAKDHSLDG